METVEAQKMARSLMRENGLSHWLFAFDRAARRFGCCNYSRRTISLSERLVVLNGPEKVREVMLHEIAHALTPNDRGHGFAWKMECFKLGIPANRCYDSSVAQPEGNYIAICRHCGKTFSSVRALKRKRSCRCGGKTFNPAYVLTFSRRETADKYDEMFADYPGAE